MNPFHASMKSLLDLQNTCHLLAEAFITLDPDCCRYFQASSSVLFLPIHTPGIGYGKPLQSSCLENFMDRGAWQATVHGATKSRTPLNTQHIQTIPGSCCIMKYTSWKHGTPWLAEKKKKYIYIYTYLYTSNFPPSDINLFTYHFSHCFSIKSSCPPLHPLEPCLQSTHWLT